MGACTCTSGTQFSMEEGGDGRMLGTMMVGCKRGDGVAQQSLLGRVSNFHCLCPNHLAVVL